MLQHGLKTLCLVKEVRHKHTYCKIPFIGHVQNRQIYRAEHYLRLGGSESIGGKWGVTVKGIRFLFGVMKSDWRLYCVV